MLSTPLRARGSSEPEALKGISANLTPLRKRGVRGDFNEDSECCGMLRVLKDGHVHCARV